MSNSFKTVVLRAETAEGTLEEHLEALSVQHSIPKERIRVAKVAESDEYFLVLPAGTGVARPPVGSTSPSSSHISALESENAMLRAEIDDLRAKVEEISNFKAEVLDTIRGMKREVATISEEVLVGGYDEDD